MRGRGEEQGCCCDRTYERRLISAGSNEARNLNRSSIIGENLLCSAPYARRVPLAGLGFSRKRSGAVQLSDASPI